MLASPANETSGANMGKGDKKTKRGKIFKGSHGKTRPKGKATKSKS